MSCGMHRSILVYMEYSDQQRKINSFTSNAISYEKERTRRDVRKN